MISLYARKNYSGVVRKWISPFPVKDQLTFIFLNDTHSMASTRISDLLPIDNVKFEFNLVKGKVEIVGYCEFRDFKSIDRSYSSTSEIINVLTNLNDALLGDDK